MHNFNDNQGRPWTLAVNIHAIKRVRGLIEVDLLTVADGSLLKQLVEERVEALSVTDRPAVRRSRAIRSRSSASLAGE